MEKEKIEQQRTRFEVYQEIAIWQRKRHGKENGEYWPDKPESALAVSRYPNILAELDASGWWVDRMARYVNVSMEIMAGVMEDNEELSWGELERVKQFFGCEMDYLISPLLSMVDPNTNKGKFRIQFLKDLVRQTEGMDRFIYNINSKNVLPVLEQGKPVTYASYRWACKNLQDALDWQAERETRQRRTRTGNIEQAQAKEDPQADLGTRLQQARESARVRDLKAKLNAMQEYANSLVAEDSENDGLKMRDLYALLDFSKRDMAGSLCLAFGYGRAVGYRWATREAEA